MAWRERYCAAKRKNTSKKGPSYIAAEATGAVDELPVEQPDRAFRLAREARVVRDHARSSIRPRAARASRSMTASPFFVSRLPVGSSASRIDGSTGERARDGDALLLAAGELRSEVFGAMRGVHALEQLGDAQPALAAASSRDRPAAARRFRRR